VITLGFCCGKTAYVKSAWNLLDLVIVCVSFLVLLAEIFPVLKPLKVPTAIRTEGVATAEKCAAADAHA
jgi:hypothetical protein